MRHPLVDLSTMSGGLQRRQLLAATAPRRRIALIGETLASQPFAGVVGLAFEPGIAHELVAATDRYAG